MLVLSRQVNEGILIGADVRIVVAEIKKDRVRIGIDAPRSIEVHRDEIAEKVAERKQCRMCHGSAWFEVADGPPVPCPGCNARGRFRKAAVR